MTFLEKFKEHAESDPINEVCGLVINFKGKEIYYPCKNISSSKPSDFSLDPTDYAKYSKLGDIKYICHSHPASLETPSTADIIGCNSSNVPWVIYSLVSKKIHVEDPTGYIQPIFGREYIFNISDCWTLIRDIYKLELNKDILKVSVPDVHWYQNPNNNFFEQYAEDAGFTKVIDNSINKYDILLFIMGNTSIPNHSGVYYGDGILAHHAFGRLSCKEIYGGYWAKTRVSTYRYKELL